MTIKVQNLTKTFYNKKVLDNISFSVEDGETLGVAGFSGSGKSTLLKIISKLLSADSGKIETTRNSDIAMTFQYSALFDFLDVYHNIAFPLLERREFKGKYNKRVGFARAIVTNPKIILYDEPTAGLDPVSSTLIEDYINQLKKELNASCIVVTHQMSTITRACDKVILLYEGKIVFKGTTEEFLKGDNPYTRQFITASIEGPMEIKSTT